MIERAVRRLELGLKEDAAIGYCFQRGGAFVGETEANEELENKTIIVVTSLCLGGQLLTVVV